jgi:hypothetical protein
VVVVAGTSPRIRSVPSGPDSAAEITSHTTGTITAARMTRASTLDPRSRRDTLGCSPGLAGGWASGGGEVTTLACSPGEVAGTAVAASGAGGAAGSAEATDVAPEFLVEAGQVGVGLLEGANPVGEDLQAVRRRG